MQFGMKMNWIDSEIKMSKIEFTDVFWKCSSPLEAYRLNIAIEDHLVLCLKLIISLCTVFHCVQNGIMSDIEGLLKKLSLLTILCSVCVTWTVAARLLCLIHSHNDHVYKYSVICFGSLHRNWKYDECIISVMLFVCVVSTCMLSVAPA